MKRGMHSDVVLQGFSKTAWWIQPVIWILENTNALHAQTDCQLNPIRRTQHFFQVFHSISEKWLFHLPPPTKGRGPAGTTPVALLWKGTEQWLTLLTVGPREALLALALLVHARPAIPAADPALLCCRETPKISQNHTVGSKQAQKNDLLRSLKRDLNDELCTIYAMYFNCRLMERFSQVFHDCYVATQNF